jgi:hypothetical protein
MPVALGMPPYDYFAIPTDEGRIPVRRSDAGTLIVPSLTNAGGFSSSSVMINLNGISQTPD